MNKKKNQTFEEIFKLAIKNHKNNNFKLAEQLYNESLNINSNSVEALNNLGILFNQLAKYNQSITCYEKAVKINPDYVPAYNNLGFAFNKLGKYKNAINCYEKALQIKPNDADALYNLANTFKELGEFKKAINFYENVLKISPNYLGAHNNLGNVFKDLEQYTKAINCYENALKINPNYAPAYNNLANTFKELGDFKKAINTYGKAIQINPTYLDAYNNLGNTFKELGQNKKAINCYEKAIKINPNHVDAHNNLGNIFKDIEEYAKAINCYEKAIQINPNHIEVHNNLGSTFKELGKHKEAIGCYNKALQIEPKNLTSHWLFMNTFPVVYKNSKEVEQYREKFKNSVEKINLLLDENSQYTKKQFLNAISSSTNFSLHYQGRDDLELQRSYAKLVERVTEKIYKKFRKDIKRSPPSKVIKIGFVSSFFRDHTVSKLFKNWILKLNKKNFKGFVYYVGSKFDHITNEIKLNADYFYNHTDVDHIINQIYQDDLDILIYLDIGMKPKIQILSSLRLAPIQCNTYGHPITSGFKNIDYYFSSELMETQNSKKYYSEKLINLPNLGISYDLPSLKNIKKPNIQNQSNPIIFLNLQSLFKLLPQDDHIYLDIIKEYPDSYFWFLNRMNDSVTKIFKNRISKLFEKEGYDFKKYFYFHPRCSQEEFFGLIQESDVILDSCNWSGGNTSLEAISLNKPIVTYPSNFMRGRYTYAILKILGIEETIATSKKKYVEIIVKLARDINFRKFIIKKIKERKKILFNDDKTVRFLENIIREKLI